MGAYINPPNCSKESWLDTFGESIDDPPTEVGPSDELLPVCLVDSGPFTAAGIAFSQEKLAEFSDPIDPRPKKWFMVPKEALLDVSNLATYLK